MHRTPKNYIAKYT